MPPVDPEGSCHHLVDPEVPGGLVFLLAAPWQTLGDAIFTVPLANPREAILLCDSGNFLEAIFLLAVENFLVGIFAINFPSK